MGIDEDLAADGGPGEEGEPRWHRRWIPQGGKRGGPTSATACPPAGRVDRTGVKHDRLRRFTAMVLPRCVTGLTFSSTHVSTGVETR